MEDKRSWKHKYFSPGIKYRPTDIQEALKDPNWVCSCHARRVELVHKKLTIMLVYRPRNHNVIGNKWVSKNKKGENDIIVRNKAKLVVQGYSQEEG